MASGDSFRLHRLAETSIAMKNVTIDTTVKELKQQISKVTNVTPECIEIFYGCTGKQAKVSDTAVQTNELPNPATLFDASNELSEGIMMRHVVPSNNSSMFASIYFALSIGKSSPEKIEQLRTIIARVVSSDPEKYTEAILGMPNEDYCTLIQNPNYCGGAIELAILSERFCIEILVVDTISLKMHHFGKDFPKSRRIFLIHNGFHYDPLVMEDTRLMQTIFRVADEGPMKMALVIAREAKSSRLYSEDAKFTHF